MRDVAVLVFNQPGKDIKVKTLVTAITPEEHVAGKDVRQATLAVVKPGKYGIAAYCVYTMRDILMQERVTLAAGSRYLISCEGSTPRVVKLVIAEQSSSD